MDLIVGEFEGEDGGAISGTQRSPCWHSCSSKASRPNSEDGKGAVGWMHPLMLLLRFLTMEL
jgi:hypothetical protein